MLLVVLKGLSGWRKFFFFVVCSHAFYSDDCEDVPNEWMEGGLRPPRKATRTIAKIKPASAASSLLLPRAVITNKSIRCNLFYSHCMVHFLMLIFLPKEETTYEPNNSYAFCTTKAYRWCGYQTASPYSTSTTK